MRFFPNIIIKLGLESQPQEKSLFRRITPKQLRENSGDEPLVYLKKQAVLLFQKAFEDAEVNLLQFNVSLTYKDSDGDDMIIHTPDDLTAALKECMEAGKIKIFAQVQNKPLQDGSTPSPSVHTSTQTSSNTTTDHETLNVTDAVEHVVGAIASATAMAANQVTRSLREIKRAERVVIRPIRVASVMRGRCRAHASTKAAPSASVDSKEEEKVSSGESPQQAETASASVNETKAVQEEETDKKPAPKSEEAGASSDCPSSEPLFIHGRHTCDGCLNTPIVGKRFHANPDYDLCETCFNNYSGDRDFEEIELDQDKVFQARWVTRLDNFRRKDCVHVCKAPSNTPHRGRPMCPFKQGGGSILEEHEHDLALKEAVRRSLDDLKDKPVVADIKPSEPTLEEALRRSDAEAEAEEVAAVEKAIEMSMEEITKSECSEPQSNTPVVSPDRSVASKSSFAQDAAGCGDVATDLGEALDRIASEIDEMTLELGRPDDEKDAEEESVKVAEESDEDMNKGATIIEGSEPALKRTETDFESKNSWHVVDGEDDCVLLDANEALGRAAQMIGSALFNSDMERSAHAPAESMSSVSSVPTTVHLDRAEMISPAPDQLERWSLQLNQLHELGFLNDQANVETIERLAAANIGVNCTDEVSVQQVIDEMMKDW